MATAPNQGIFTDSYSTFRYDPIGRADILSARGYAIVTNGLDPNTKIDSENGQTDLFMRAPADEVVPAVTFAPSAEGKLFGNNFKWRIRYSNSKTGETSGMSPLPSVGFTLGVSLVNADHHGQIAYFKIAGTAATGVDTIELLRNTSNQDDVFFLVDKTTNPGSGNYVTFTDNTPDDELWNNEQSTLRINPSYFEPHPPPCARAFQHATGRVWLYGHRSTGTYTRGTVASVVGLPAFGGGFSPLTGPTITGSSTGWHRGLEGQRLRLDTDLSKTIYRIIEVTGLITMNVTPDPKKNVPLAGAYEILDDIDTRNIYMTQPLSPCQFDPRDVFTVGQDRSDGVTGVFAWQGSTYAFTRRRIYRLDDDISEDPRNSIRINKVADVGCVGFWAWTETPFGVVFVSEKHGVMLFDGGTPVSLGSPTPWADFMPKTQFEDFDEGVLFDCYVSWDRDNKLVVVSYCPEGMMLQVEQLVFDPTTLTWRGPWRRPVYTTGTLRDSLGEDVYLVGDFFGGMFRDDDSVNDGVDSVTTGAILSVDSPVVVTRDPGTAFVSAMAGASIVFNDGAGNYYTHFVARALDSDTVILLMHPSTSLTATWTFVLGGIHWKALTGYLDFGEPMLPKKLNHLGLRWGTMATNVDTLIVDGISDGGTITEAAVAAASAFTEGLVKGDANLSIGGTAFQVRLSGLASYGGPKITRVIAYLDVRGGTSDADTSDSIKISLTPTAS